MFLSQPKSADELKAGQGTPVSVVRDRPG